MGKGNYLGGSTIVKLRSSWSRIRESNDYALRLTEEQKISLAEFEKKLADERLEQAKQERKSGSSRPAKVARTKAKSKRKKKSRKRMLDEARRNRS
ncbi:hypothetical protein [Yoonia sp. R2-816]|uniref:hypothetical protein n=1 Tax=Yoonia sp. R2-816 TaxID=3342638 RepID=UPI003729C594